ncbi:hypothetical protein B7P43_G12483 [Cryptotermes secundus]|uniref:RNA-directed DNA polymerase n=1 Tax=Cryptotermes secundus TaxID=105785 RepID=A0A2J7PPW9_9NEOP|nr:hypothetical protein B7P43_G12483 [Cryptotermes secundus]
MRDDLLGHYEVYVVSRELKGELGVALLDTGSQVSLVKESSLIKFSKEKDKNLRICGVTGKQMEIKGKVKLRIENTLEPLYQICYVVDSLPRNLDIILGQDWLDNAGYGFQKKTPVIIPPYSEQVIKCKTLEKGVRFIEHQILQPGLICAASLVNCETFEFPCLVMNLTDKPICMTADPKLEKPPTMLHRQNFKNQTNRIKRLQLLKENLRLDHITEGASDIRKICEEYVDIFKLPGDSLTATSAAEHTIPTPTIPKGKAITLRNYRLPEAQQQEIKRQVTQMLEEDIVTPSNSGWNFPLLVVPKKLDASGKRKWRICVDFRKLNEVTVGDSYPLPNIQDILDKLGRARYFTALDCASGYLQVPIAEEDRCKTAFSTADGHFEYKRMPFGLKSAPSTFQRMMNNVLSELIGNRCLVYMDDILIIGETLEEHNSKLRAVFEKLHESNLKIEPDKCEFLKEELSYLGHIVTAEGVKPDDKKIEAVVKFPIPQSQKDVKSFLGLAGYYRKFIADFSAIARPLTNLLKKENEWNWTEKEQTSFDLLKIKLTNTPLLQYPDFSKPFILTTDASGYAIGAILSQGKLGQDKPIAYASRTLNKAELNYATVEKELLAIVWACKHFRPYLLGRKFQIVTDHKGLTWIFNVKDPSSRLMRWKLLLEEYDYEIQYRAGHRNCNADSLSRYPIQCFNVNVEEITNERKQKIIAEMHNCPVGGHQGIQRTIERIKLYISWPGLEQDVIKYIRECKTCQLNKETRPNIKLPLTVTDTRNIPWEKVYLDVVGPLPTTETGMKYILTCQDNLSKYFIVIPMQNQTADEVTDVFVKNIILSYGIPTEIVTDQGSNFMSDVFKRICKLFQIEKVCTTAYHPESNGALERTHKTLTNYLRCFCDKKLNDWDEWLPFACFTYNTTPHSITKYTPYEVLFGRVANIPGKLQRQPQPIYNFDDIVLEIKQKMQTCQQLAKERLIKFKESQGQKVKSNSYEFKENDLALLRIENRQKLDPLWKGPYEIKKIQGSNAVIQELGKRRHQEVHINRLKPYFFHSISENADT